MALAVRKCACVSPSAKAAGYLSAMMMQESSRIR